jgi:hypothetical protein
MRKFLVVVPIAIAGLLLSACGGQAVNVNSPSFQDGYDYGIASEQIWGNSATASQYCNQNQMVNPNDAANANDIFSDWQAGCQSGWAKEQSLPN